MSYVRDCGDVLVQYELQGKARQRGIPGANPGAVKARGAQRGNSRMGGRGSGPVVESSAKSPCNSPRVSMEGEGV